MISLSFDRRTPASKFRPDTLRRRLILLMLAVLAPAIATTALLLWTVDQNARRSVHARLQETARALSLVVDRQFGEQAVLLDALAVSEEVRRGDWEAVDRQARRVLDGKTRWLVVYDESDQQLVNTRVPHGTALPITPISPDGWAGELKPGVHVSNLFHGPVAKAHVVALSRWAQLADGRRVRVSVTTAASDFERIFRDQHLSPSWTASLLDSQHTLVARSRDAQRLVGRKATPDMQSAIAKGGVGIVRTETLDGVKTMSAFSRLPNYGWTVLVGVPRKELSTISSGPGLLGAGLSFGLIALGVVLAVREARRIERPVRNLAHAARAWQAGRAPEITSEPAPREIGDLSEAFIGAIDLLRTREDALSEAGTRLGLALKAAGAGAWDWDLRTGVVTWSRELFELVGVPPQEPGAGLFDVWMQAIHPDDRERVERTAREAMQSTAPFSTDLRIVRGDTSEVRWLRSHGAPILDAAGSVTRLVGVNLDVTELRAREAALESDNARLTDEVDARTRELDRIWKLSRDPFLIADAGGRWLRASPAWTDILGWSQEELIGQTSEWMEHPDDRARTRRQDERLARGEVVTRFENRFRAKDGSYRWFAWTAVPYEGFNYCVARDVTAEKEAEAELQRAQEALRQAQKMDAIGQLTGGVAHDFNNLLTPIVGSLDILQRRATLEERDARLLEGAAQSAERARVLVQRLLAFARRQPLQPKPLDAHELLHGMSDLIGSTLGPRILVVVDAPEGLPKVRGDRNQLEMALLNLAVNGRDAMPDGGVLTMAARKAVQAAGGPDLAAGEYVCISVTDTGSGMDEATLTRATEPFFSTKGVGKGTGLGLSMAHGLVAQLGGALRISSRPSVGTTVELWLPKAAVARPDGALQQEGSPLGRGEGVVLLVDDEVQVRLTTAAMLGELGYSVVEAPGGREALRLVEGGLRPDLIVTDHIMPTMTGTELLDALRARGVDAPALVVSGYAEVDRLPQELPRLTKPFLQSELARKLAELLASDPARLGVRSTS